MCRPKKHGKGGGRSVEAPEELHGRHEADIERCADEVASVAELPEIGAGEGIVLEGQEGIRVAKRREAIRLSLSSSHLLPGRNDLEHLPFHLLLKVRSPQVLRLEVRDLPHCLHPGEEVVRLEGVRGMDHLVLLGDVVAAKEKDNIAARVLKVLDVCWFWLEGGDGVEVWAGGRKQRWVRFCTVTASPRSARQRERV